MRECLKRIKELETLFSDHQYNGSGETAFWIEEGTIPVMISAPHAVNHFRGGEVKWADRYTGGIARYLHERTGCHLICSGRYMESDPNYDEPGTNEYQDALAEFLKNHKVAVLLDLHGAAKRREYAVELGTAPEQNPLPGVEYEIDPSLHELKFISELIKQRLEDKCKALSKERWTVCKNQLFDAGGQNTITKYISEHTQTACIQLEINGIYRDPEKEENMICLVSGLIEIIGEIAERIREQNPIYPL